MIWRALVFLLLGACSLHCAPSRVLFTTKTNQVPAGTVFEIQMEVGKPDASNPFTDATVIGHFGRQSSPLKKVEGFCDSDMGRLYRIRFTPPAEGVYEYSITFSQEEFTAIEKGIFTATSPVIRVRNFSTSTNAAFLLQLSEKEMGAAISNLHSKLVIPLHGRFYMGTQEVRLNPWIAQRPLNLDNPGFDLTRFNNGHWEKIEKILLLSDSLEYPVTLEFFLNVQLPGVNPFVNSSELSASEALYYRFAIARFASFPNLEWKVSKPSRSSRQSIQKLFEEWDPSAHPLSFQN